MRPSIVVSAALLVPAFPALSAIHDVHCGDFRQPRACATANDDTCAINNAIAEAHNEGGGVVRISSGKPCIAGGDVPSAVHLQPNVILEGFGWGSVIEQRENTRFLIYTDSGSANPAGNIADIVVRDLRLRGPKVHPLLEHEHLVSLNGVSDVLIDHVQFVGWQADALYIGTTDDGKPERHNRRVTVRESHFDGIDENDRMAISIIDCDSCRILNNYFTRTSASGMPGAIDVEPDHPFDVIRDITVRDNRFDDIGGVNGAINIVIGKTLSTPPSGFRITGNQVQRARGNGVFVRVMPSDAPLGLVIDDNTFTDTEEAFIIEGAKSVRVANNSIQEARSPSRLGMAIGVADVRVTANFFGRVAAEGGTEVQVGSADHVMFEDNLLRGSVTFGEGRSSHVQFVHNTFTDLAAATLPITKEPRHSADAMTNVIAGNLGPRGMPLSSLPALEGGSENSYGTTQLPGELPPGRWITYVHGDGPTAQERGELITEKADSSGAFAMQWYVPVEDGDVTSRYLYIRRASIATDAWLAWLKIPLLPAAGTNGNSADRP